MYQILLTVVSHSHFSFSILVLRICKSSRLLTRMAGEISHKSPRFHAGQENGEDNSVLLAYLGEIGMQCMREGIAHGKWNDGGNLHRVRGPFEHSPDPS
jgi:hypothetical protein